MTSGDVPAAMALQDSHLPQGSGVGPSWAWQLRHIPRRRAMVVFPVPR